MKKSEPDVELEKALTQVNKEIEENNLQSQPASKPKQEKRKMKKPTKTKAAKTKAAPKSKKASTKAEPAGYLAKDLAAEFDLVPAELRKALRVIKAEKPGKAWAWPKKTDKGLVAIRKALKEHFKAAASKAKASAKPKKEKKAPTKKAATKKVKKTKKTKKVEGEATED